MSYKALAASAVAFWLVCVPMGLAAQEREVRAAAQAPVLDWFSGIWGEVTAWFGASVGDGSCDVDPNGCPHGAAAPAQPPVDSASDGRCAVDPNGCPGGV